MNLPSDSALPRARVAVSAVFLVLGAGTGLWAAEIPVVQARLAIDPGVLGLALLSGALGAVLTMPLTGLALGRFGSRVPTAAFALAYPSLAAVVIWSPSTPILFAALFLFGAAMGGLDVAVNTQAAEVETARGRPTMSSFHGFFSVGGLVGAGAGAGVIALGWGTAGAALVAAVFLATAGLANLGLWRSELPVHAGPRFVLPNRMVIGLGIITMLAFAAEGAVVDWSALYLATEKLSSTAMAAAGFAAFSVTMTVCRLTGDAIVARLGGRATVFLGGILIAAGIAFAVAVPSPLLAALGFAVVGIGAANIVPVAFSAAAAAPGLPPGMGVAAVTTMGYSGFLIVPPLLGFVGKTWNLSVSLVIVVLMGLIIAAMARAVNR